MMTGKSFTSFAFAMLAIVSIGAMATADDALDLKNDRYTGDETGGVVSATGQMSKTLGQSGGTLNVVVNYVVEQTVSDVNQVQTTKTQDVQMVVPVTVTPRLNPRKKLIGYTFNVLSGPIEPISLVGTGETAVTAPMIISVELRATVTLNNAIIADESEDLFDYYDTDDDDDDDDDDDH